MAELINKTNVVSDGLDNMALRFVAEESCKKLRIPFIYIL